MQFLQNICQVAATKNNTTINNNNHSKNLNGNGTNNDMKLILYKINIFRDCN